MFIPFFEQKIQGLFKDFQKHVSHFSRSPFSAKKSLESVSFLVLPQHEQFYPQGLSVFVPFPLEFYLNYKVSIEIQDHTPTDCAKPCAIEASRWNETVYLLLLIIYSHGLSNLAFH